MRGTKETIVAAQVAKDHGASTIAIYVDESGLTEVCDYKIQYDSLAVDESCMGRTNSAVVTMIAMELTQQTEGYAEYETRALMERGDHGNQHIRIVFNGVEVKMVFPAQDFFQSFTIPQTR